MCNLQLEILKVQSCCSMNYNDANAADVSLIEGKLML